MHHWKQGGGYRRSHLRHSGTARLLALAIGLGGIAGCGLPAQDISGAAQAEQPPAVDAAIAQAGGLDAELAYTGTTRPEQQVSLRARIDGEVTALTVDIGDPVDLGQTVARLDADTFTMIVNQTEAELQARRAEVAEAEAAVSDAQTALEAARVQMRQNQLDADRLAQLANEGAVPAQAAEQAQVTAATAAQMEQSAAEQIRTRRATVAAAQQRVEAQQAILNEAQEQLSFAVVQAPLAGVVLSRLVDVGDYAESGDELMQVGDLSQIKVLIEVSDRELGRIRVGQPVDVRLDAFPEKALAGEVSRIAPAADATSRLIPVEILIPNPTGRIGSGLLARVTLQSPGGDRIVVPNRALELGENPETPTVFVVQNPEGSEATVQARTVTTGRQTDNQTEILSGLSPGETIVVRSSGPLSSGQGVRLSILSDTNSPQ